MKKDKFHLTKKVIYAPYNQDSAPTECSFCGEEINISDDSTEWEIDGFCDELCMLTYYINGPFQIRAYAREKLRRALLEVSKPWLEKKRANHANT